MVIPKLHYISQGKTPQEHLDNIQQACIAGIELIQLNLKDISEKKLLKIAEKAQEITTHYQTRLIITNNYNVAKQIKADGVYFNDTPKSLATIRKNLHAWQLIGCSASNLEQCNTLIASNVDYIALGSYKDNTGNTNLNKYISIIDELKTETPIIAFGRITLKDVPEIIKTGINGIASSKEITQDFNRILIFNKLLNASSTQEQLYNFE